MSKKVSAQTRSLRCVGEPSVDLIAFEDPGAWDAFEVLVMSLATSRAWDHIQRRSRRRAGTSRTRMRVKAG